MPRDGDWEEMCKNKLLEEQLGENLPRVIGLGHTVANRARVLENFVIVPAL